MKANYLFLSLFFLLSTVVNAQKIHKTSTKKPASIYTFSNNLNTSNSFAAINKKLRLDKLDFVIVNQTDIDSKLFSINFIDLYREPSTYIYEDYRKYQDENLLKGFKEKYDSSYWNLHCPQPNLPPNN